MRRLLGIRNARIYLLGQILSLFGDTSLWLAMGIRVKTLTGSDGAAGLVLFAFALPQLFAPRSGMLVDRVRRRRLLAVTNVLTGCVVLLLLRVHSADQVWLIYLVMVLYGGAYTVLTSAQAALLKTIVPDDLLGDANGVLRTVHEGLRLVGPLTGARLFAVFGGGAVAVLDAATFAVVDQGLHRPASFIGVVVVAQGVGAGVSGAVASTVMRRTGEAMLMARALAVFAAGSLLMVAASLPVVLAGSLLIGFSVPWLVVGFSTLLQRRTPDRLMGRVSAAADLLVGTPQTISIAVGAALISLIDYRIMLVAVAAVVTSAAVYLSTRRDRQWQRPSLAHRWQTAPPSPSAQGCEPGSDR